MLILCLLLLHPTLGENSTSAVLPDTTPGPSKSLPSYTKSPSITPTASQNYTVLDAEITNPPTTLHLVLQYGELGRIECYSKDRKDKQFTWYKDGQVILSAESRTKYQIVNGSRLDAGGLYKCSASTREVNFMVFIELDAASVVEEEVVTEDVEVSYGDRVELNTTLNVYPIDLIEYSLIFWEVLDRNMIDLASYPEQDLKQDVVLSNASMTLRYIIASATPDNHGLYKFVLRYGDRVKNVEIFLKVTFAPQILAFSPAPDFVSIGEDIALTLKIAGYPPPDITWYHQPCCPQLDSININDLIVQDADEFRFYHLLNDETTLNLIGGLKKFNGSFWFEARNDIGSVVSDITEYRIRGFAISIDAASERNVSRQVEYENIGSLRMTCIVNMFSVKDTDVPDITWYHGGVEIANTTGENIGDDIRQILQVDTPGLSDAGTYNCIARSNFQTFWSFNVEVVIVKQPFVSVSPKVYEASAGATVIFSCFVDNIDGVRGVDWDVRYRVKQSHQFFRDISQIYPGSGKDGLLYIPNVKKALEVRCEPTPPLHNVPRYSIGEVQIVDQPPVTVNIAINKKRYTEGETLVIRCVMTSALLASSSPSMFWKHDSVVIGGPADGVGVMEDGTVIERYFTKQHANRTTEVLFIENIGKKNAGTYTCVFDAGENGRYEDYYEITVHPKAPLNAISLIIAICFVFILVIVMTVVLACVIKRARRHSYCVSDKQIPDPGPGPRDMTSL